MTSSNDRPTSVQDRTRPARSTSLPHLRQPAPDVDASPQHSEIDRTPDPVRADKPVPQGWGSHEERRLMLWFVTGFALLALYAAAFVIVGEVLWS